MQPGVYKLTEYSPDSWMSGKKVMDAEEDETVPDRSAVRY
jgi:hypothetical protein